MLWIFALIVGWSQVHAAFENGGSSATCQRLLTLAGYQLAAEPPLPLPEFNSRLPLSPQSTGRYTAVLITMRPERSLPLQWLNDFSVLARKFQIAVPPNLQAIGVMERQPLGIAALVGKPADMRDFLGELAPMAPQAQVGAFLLVEAAPLKLPEIGVDSGLLSYDRQHFQSFLHSITGMTETNLVRIFNDPMRGMFIAVLPMPILNSYMAAAADQELDDIRQTTTQKLDLETLTAEDFSKGLIDIREGRSRLVLRGDGEDKVALVGINEFEDFQELSVKLNRRYPVPYIQISAADLASIIRLSNKPIVLEEAEETKPEPVTFYEESLNRTQSASEFYAQSAFKFYDDPQSEFHLTLQKPVVLIKNRSRLVTVALSIEAALKMEMDQINHIYQVVAGRELPEKAKDQLAVYKEQGRRANLDRRMAKAFGVADGPGNLEELSKTPSLVIIAGKIRARVLTPDTPDSFILLPVIKD